MFSGKSVAQTMNKDPFLSSGPLQDQFLLPAGLMVLQCVPAVPGLRAQTEDVPGGVPGLLCPASAGPVPDPALGAPTQEGQRQQVSDAEISGGGRRK